MTTDTIEKAGQTLDHLATFNAQEASPDRLFGGEGFSLSGQARKNRAKNNPRYIEARDEVHRLYDRVLEGDRKAGFDFVEAMSTSDFSNLFGDILDRQILGHYAVTPVMWEKFVRRGTVRDFRTVNRLTLDGGESTLAKVNQLAPYPAAALVDGKYQYAVSKYGRRFPLSWEAMINDDLDAFRRLPASMARAARRTEERFATDLFAGTTGPDGTFYSTGNLNLINPTVLGSGSITNPALTISSLELANQVIDQQVDVDGDPIYVQAKVLMVPPALRTTAMNILHATTVETATGSGGASSDAGRGNKLTVNNWLAGDIELVINPWLPKITTTNGNTTWYLFAQTGDDERPAAEMGFLTGHEAPELFMKSPNALRLSGGLAAAEDGDFDSDSMEWKVRHTLGGTLMSPKMSTASNGTGS